MPQTDKETCSYHDLEEGHVTPSTKLVLSLATIMLSPLRNYHSRQSLYTSRSSYYYLTMTKQFCATQSPCHILQILEMLLPSHRDALHISLKKCVVFPESASPNSSFLYGFTS